MSDKYAQDLALAKAILAGDSVAWQTTTAQVLRAIGSWKCNDTIDYQSITNSAIYKAANSYLPKRKFLNHTIQIARNMLCQAFRYNKVRGAITSCSIEQVPDKVDFTPDVLDIMIAKEDALLLLSESDKSYVMSQLILAGKTRAEAARIMNIDRFQAHAIIVKMRAVIEEE